MLNYKNILGYYLFKESEKDIDIIRVVKVQGKDENKKLTIKDSKGNIKNLVMEDLKGYTPLEPDAYITFNVVELLDSENKIANDVIVTASKFLNIKIGDTFPFAICRQSITDIFYNLLITKEDDMMVGLSVNQNNCPAGYDIGLMLACNNILFGQAVNMYRTDTLEDIYPMIDIKKFDTCLGNLYKKHCDHVGDPTLQFKKQHQGWCKDLKTLLKENAFMSDINEMLGVSDVKFNIADYLVEKDLPGHEGETYNTVTQELGYWLSSIYKVNMSDICVLEFGHDINLGDFNNSRYILLRDNTQTLYLLVYTEDGEYYEADLEAKDKELDFSSKFRLDFYSKYNADIKK